MPTASADLLGYKVKTDSPEQSEVHWLVPPGDVALFVLRLTSVLRI